MSRHWGAGAGLLVCALIVASSARALETRAPSEPPADTTKRELTGGHTSRPSVERFRMVAQAAAPSVNALDQMSRAVVAEYVSQQEARQHAQHLQMTSQAIARVEAEEKEMTQLYLGPYANRDEANAVGVNLAIYGLVYKVERSSKQGGYVVRLGAYENAPMASRLRQEIGELDVGDVKTVLVKHTVYQVIRYHPREPVPSVTEKQQGTGEGGITGVAGAGIHILGEEEEDDSGSMAVNATRSQTKDTVVSIKNGVRIKSRTGDFAFRFGGRLHADVAYYDQDETQLGSGTALRRARLYVSGALPQRWRFRAEYDFAGNDVSVKDAWIGFFGAKLFAFKVGNFLQPFSLEALTSSNTITFMERALPNVFAPGYRLGAGGSYSGQAWNVSASLFGDAVDEPDEEVDEAWGIAARVTTAPIRERGRVLHIGVATVYETTDGNDKTRFRVRPESAVTDRRLVDTRTMNNVDHTVTYGLEAAFVQGAWSAQAEYMRVGVSRDDIEDLVFDGWYIYGSWFVTGESRRYRFGKGNFRPIEPKAKTGAWEVALRYSQLNLTDQDVSGGKQDDITLGVNWYPNKHVRFMANYISVNADPNRNGIRDQPRIIQFRAQVFF